MCRLRLRLGALGLVAMLVVGLIALDWTGGPSNQAAPPADARFASEREVGLEIAKGDPVRVEVYGLAEDLSPKQTIQNNSRKVTLKEHQQALRSLERGIAGSSKRRDSLLGATADEDVYRLEDLNASLQKQQAALAALRAGKAFATDNLSPIRQSGDIYFYNLIVKGDADQEVRIHLPIDLRDSVQVHQAMEGRQAMKEILEVKELNAWNSQPFEERKRIIEDSVAARSQANTLLNQAANLAKALQNGTDPSSVPAIQVLQEKAQRLLAPYAKTPRHFDPRSYEARPAPRRR